MSACRVHPSSVEITGEAPPVPTGAVPSPAGGEVDSARLLHGQRELLIRHGSEVYRLRHTRNDKLILTK